MSTGPNRSMIINFNLIVIVKQYLWNKVTLTGKLKEVVYLDRHDNKIPVFSESQTDDVGAIWLNSNIGAGHNDKFSILLIDDAIKINFILHFGIIVQGEE